MTASPPSITPDPAVRGALRTILTASEQFQALDPGTRRDLASSLVRVAHAATTLAADSEPAAPRPALAAAQSAGDIFSGTAVDRVARSTQQILNAVSFPRFVTELITGVFKAMNDSNQQQLQAYVELIRNVAATTEGFADAQIGTAGARQWLAEKFPGNFTIQGMDDDTSAEERAAMSPEERQELQAERDRSTRLVLSPGASMPSEGALRSALSLRPDEPLPSASPEALVGFARAAMARNRQQMLGSMVMMGLQRIVIESGRISAGMRFHIDASSAAQEDKGSSFDFRNEVAASGSFGMGPWGASASVKNTIGYVTTDQQRTTESLNTNVDLNSQVELVFRSDYVPLTRLAGVEEVERIKVNTLNPYEEERLAAQTDQARMAQTGRMDEARLNKLDARLAAPRGTEISAPPVPPPQPDRANQSQQRPGQGANQGPTPPGGGGGANRQQPPAGGNQTGGSATNPQQSPSGGGQAAGGGATNSQQSPPGGGQAAGGGAANPQQSPPAGRQSAGQSPPPRQPASAQHQAAR